jgi:hypothetical protein
MASNNETRLLIETTNDQDHKVVGVTTKTGRNLLQKIFSNLTGSPSAVQKVGDDFVVKGNGRTIETFFKDDYKQAINEAE